MIKNVLSDLGGVGLYGVISVCLFFIVFSGALLWTLLQRRALMTEMGSLPLNDGEMPNFNEGESRHE
ncbi:MAG: cbb3-type cytochrome c oxidase subunit 3 [Verrucomicrobiota bacterium]